MWVWKKIKQGAKHLSSKAGRGRESDIPVCGDAIDHRPGGPELSLSLTWERLARLREGQGRWHAIYAIAYTADMHGHTLYVVRRRAVDQASGLSAYDFAMPDYGIPFELGIDDDLQAMIRDISGQPLGHFVFEDSVHRWDRVPEIEFDAIRRRDSIIVGQVSEALLPDLQGARLARGTPKVAMLAPDLDEAPAAARRRL